MCVALTVGWRSSRVGAGAATGVAMSGANRQIRRNARQDTPSERRFMCFIPFMIFMS